MKIFQNKTEKNFPAKNKKFLKYISRLFDIAHEDTFSIIQHDRSRTRKMILEDMQFLENQQSCRKMELPRS